MRRDPMTGDWVVMAPRRGRRPQDFAPGPWKRQAGRCPFCRGHETDTPPPLAVYPSASYPSASYPSDMPPIGPPIAPSAASRDKTRDKTRYDQAATPRPAPAPWQVRVVPNKYPATRHHEVVVESPEHVTSLTQLDDHQAGWTFLAYRDRLRVLSDTPEVRYAQVFKNFGPAAGASLEHVHSQVLGLPRVPPRVSTELARCGRFFRRNGGCLLCRIMSRAVERDLVVARSPGCLAWCPFASRFPFEVWIAPRSHQGHYERSEEPLLWETARLTREVLRRIESCLPHAAYNYYLHTSPFDGFDGGHYHWHLEIVPRIARAAGFEWATDMAINPVLPEAAAEQLRRVAPDS